MVAIMERFQGQLQRLVHKEKTKSHIFLRVVISSQTQARRELVMAMYTSQLENRNNTHPNHTTGRKK